jgi:hypothetical protein
MFHLNLSPPGRNRSVLFLTGRRIPLGEFRPSPWSFAVPTLPSKEGGQ